MNFVILIFKYVIVIPRDPRTVIVAGEHRHSDPELVEGEGSRLEIRKPQKIGEQCSVN